MEKNREKQKAEAVERMRLMGFDPEYIKAFEEHGKVGIALPPGGYFCDADEELLDEIKKFEREQDALVYTVIRTYTGFGVLDSYFHVSKYDEDWELDREDIAGGQVCAYVDNRDAPECSEFGSVGFEITEDGRLVRTW